MKPAAWAICLIPILGCGCGGASTGGDGTPATSRIWVGMHMGIATVWQYALSDVQAMRIEMDDASNIVSVRLRNSYDVVTERPTASLAGTQGNISSYDVSDGTHWTAVRDPGKTHMMIVGTDTRELAILQRGLMNVTSDFALDEIAGSWTGQAWRFNTTSGVALSSEAADAEIVIRGATKADFVYTGAGGVVNGTLYGFYYQGGSFGYVEGVAPGSADTVEVAILPTQDRKWLAGYIGNIGDGLQDPKAHRWPDEFTLFYLAHK